MMNRLSIMAGAIVAGVVVGLIVVVAVVTHRIWGDLGALADLECGTCLKLEELLNHEHFQGHFGPSWMADGERIAFGHPAGESGPRESSWEAAASYREYVYVVRADGAGLTRLVPQEAPSDDIFALDYFSDVGQSKIAFVTLRHGRRRDRAYEIATTNYDGSDYRRLTDEDGSDLSPVWSPDDAKIAFISNRAAFVSREDAPHKEDFNLYVMDADGSNVRRIAPSIFVPPHQPLWSPDGAWLAFRGWRALYAVHTESLATVNLGLTVEDPAWSPDGEWIAFVHAEPAFEEPGTIYVARPDGSEARKVFQFDPRDAYTGALNLSWSADGLSLRFSLRPSDADRSNIYFLYQVGVDGSNLHKISEVPYAARLSWSPDGSRVAVSSIGITQYPRYDHGETLLYSMAADGSDRRVLVRQGLNGPEAANGE